MLYFHTRFHSNCDSQPRCLYLEGESGSCFFFSAAQRSGKRRGREVQRAGGREEGGRSAGGWLTRSAASSPISFLKKNNDNKKKLPSFVTSAGLLWRTSKGAVCSGGGKEGGGFACEQYRCFHSCPLTSFALSQPSWRRVQSMGGIEWLISPSNVP